MTEKELRKLNRTELLQLLLIQTRENERLQKELDAAHRQIADRRLRVEKAGNLAQAVLEINHVLEAAQKAAEQYLLNISAMEQETEQRCERMLMEAQDEAELILGRARASALEVPEEELVADIYKLLD